MVEDTPLDPASSAALIAEQRAKVEAATDVDGRILFGAWAWPGCSASACCGSSTQGA